MYSRVYFMLAVFLTTTLPIFSQPTWSLINSRGIQHGNDYLTGRLWDGLEINSENLLVASDNSGVWWLRKNASAISISKDWDGACIYSLTKNPARPGHYYAGGHTSIIDDNGVLWETKPDASAPLFSNWNRVQLPGSTTSIRRVITLANPYRIVLATNNGILWSLIPITGGSYSWNWARGTVGGYWDIREGPNSTIIAGAFEHNTSSGSTGILKGTWNSSGNLMELQFNNVSFSPGSAINKSYTTSVAVYPGNKQIMYAVSSDRGGMLAHLWKSEDGGNSWIEKSAKSNNGDQHIGIATEGRQGAAYNNCIIVSPNDPNTVIVGWIHLLISQDGGQRFKMMNTGHDDHHNLFFSGSKLYTCSDGGIHFTTDLGRTTDGSFNKNLPNLTFYPYAFDAWYGTYAGGTFTTVGGGMQDHPAVYCQWNSAQGPGYWKYFTSEDFGDGGPVALYSNGATFTRSSTGIYQYSRSTQPGSFGPGTNIEIVGVSAPELGENGFSHELRMFAVPKSIRRDETGKLLKSLLFSRTRNGDNTVFHIYGLFVDNAGGSIIRHLLDDEQPSQFSFAASIYSFDGSVIYLGLGPTSAIRKFEFQLKNGRWELVNKSFQQGLPNTGLEEYVDQISAGSLNDIFASVTPRSRLTSRLYQFNRSTNTWTEVTGLPGTMITSIACLNSGTVFVSTRTNVYRSVNNRSIWTDISHGLPKNTWISRMIIAGAPANKHFLYLATDGWSVWKYPVD